MFGNSSKRGGRGGGAAISSSGHRNRNSFPPPPHRNPNPAGRIPLGGGGSRQRTNTTSVKGGAAAAAAASSRTVVEETFSLIPGKKPPAFAMIIRLAPDLVDEIRKLEAAGSTARIKFDAFSNNTSGNVINVGDKEFKFTWSREFGDLCDIYEERQSGEDGNGLLVESGCAWRKLNVQRTLDESTTNHVKMLSEEAERKTKSRKAIVLDPGNPSLTKQLAMAEANPWRMPYKQKKEPPIKKRKIDPPQVVPKPAYKPGLASTASAKGKLSASPGPSPPDQSNAPASPNGTGNLTKSHASNEDATPIQAKSKESIVSAEKDFSAQTNRTAGESSGRKPNFGGKTTNLQGVLINLLKEAPMSLKALEKAIGDMIPNSAKKIEPILKKIATFQAPGRYFLKPGVDSEDFKKSLSESGSSPENDHQQLPNSEHNHDEAPLPGPSLVEKISVDVTVGQARQKSILGEQSNAPENVDIQRHSPDLFREEKASDNKEGGAGSSSDTGSDSDSESDSSDSGSDSESHSRSAVGSESGTSSDSDASSNSKEGSDEDVDIMSDDDIEPKQDLPSSDVDRTLHDETAKKQVADGSDAIDIEGQGSDAVDIEGQGSDAVDIEGHGSDAVDIEGHGSDAVDIEGHGSDAVDIEGHGSYAVEGHGSDAVDIEGHGSDAVDIEGHGSDAVDIEGHSSDEGDGLDAVEKSLPAAGWETEAARNASPVANKEDGKPGIEHFSSDHDELQGHQDLIGSLFGDTENITKESFKREKSDSSERLSKGKTKRGLDLEGIDPKSEQTKRLKAESFTQPSTLWGKDSQFSDSMQNFSPNTLSEEPHEGFADKEGNIDLGPQRASKQISVGKSSSDFQQSGHKKSARAKAPDGSEKSNKHTDTSVRVRKSTEKDFYGHEVIAGQTEKGSRNNQRNDSFVKERKLPRNLKDADSVGKNPLPSDARNRRHSEPSIKFKEAANFSSVNLGSSPIDKNGIPPKGNGAVLHRELSDLELGELREPFAEEPVVKKLEKKNSFIHSDNKPSSSDNCVLDLGKGKPSRKSNFDSGKPSPPNASAGIKGTPEHHLEDLTRSHSRVLQQHTQHHLRADHVEAASQHSKLADAGNKARQNDSGARQGGSIEGYGESLKKAAGAPEQHGSRRGPVSHSVKESRTHKSDATTNSVDRLEDPSLAWDDNLGQKKREASSYEDDSSYLKYEKDKPELKGPINDFLQYKEYVQEYRDKYDSYCSLNRILESYRNEFQKLGADLEFTKDRDMKRYGKIVKQLKKSYHECGERHKRLKKIFIVLHEELKHLKQTMKDYAISLGKHR